jgi:parallel beta-helix repeat protein
LRIHLLVPRGRLASTLLALGILAGCNGKDPLPHPAAQVLDATVLIRPGPNVQEELQTALIKAKPGSIIELTKGTFEFTKELSLAVEKVTIRGHGVDNTILSFKKQDTGKHGLLITRGDFCIQDLTVEDTKGDGLKANDVENVIFRRVRARWTDGEKETNGAYGIYPVQCTNVLVEDCEAVGASDAGIYVGQSKNVIVRRCKASKNVAGIEIENCIDADVYENTATDNAGGLLVFDLPGLQQKNGKRIRVHDNLIYGNNHANFAPKGNTVASVAPGTGAMIMATDQVEFFRNMLKNNHTYGLSIVSFTNLGKPVEDKQYDPYPEGIFVHDNDFVDCGTAPQGDLAAALTALLGKPFPEIIYDGEVNPAKLVNGKVPPEFGLVLKNNGAAKFANLGKNVLKLLDPSNGPPKIDRDIKTYEGELPPLPVVKLPGID